jgi:hypothetical protein
MATTQLQALLDSFEARLAVVESACGTSTGAAGKPTSSNGALFSSFMHT